MKKIKSINIKDFILVPNSYPLQTQLVFLIVDAVLTNAILASTIVEPKHLKDAILLELDSHLKLSVKSLDLIHDGISLNGEITWGEDEITKLKFTL
jgi:hypothetical protein